MKVLMEPNPLQFNKEESGIRRVIEAYYKYLPQFGVEFVSPDTESYDLKAIHISGKAAHKTVVHNHGLYWTADLSCGSSFYKANRNIIEVIRHSDAITVPSEWVAEAFQRDMRFSPYVIGHGIEWEEWQHDYELDNYVLWNKNRIGDVCSPEAVNKLAVLAPDVLFLSTFANKNSTVNVKTVGLQPHAKMKRMIQQAGVYLSTAKETFGIGVLEAMASGIPILGWDHGGNRQLVQHGVNGYLAARGNYKNLLEGLRYCLEYQQTLGANGQEIARQWTWERACEQVYQVYQDVLNEDNEPTISVVIPVYNKTVEQVERAINSALIQTIKPDSIIVINDGSDLDYKLVQELGTQVKYIKQSNQGVAIARNNGIAQTNSKYICCLDADDWIEPEFLERCLTQLEAHKGLGLAYTKLRYHGESGRVVVSEWPEQFDYDNQLRRKNQIPTCCVFKREAWQRIGGYRQRYAPLGAGSEDAAFWTMFGAIGYDAALVTPEPLFNYSGGGQVGGNPNYKERDWLALYPWVKDHQHPFASIAKPKHFSHPVRQHDEPIVSVIIPVGPGHEGVLFNALDSLEAQTFRKWEVIVVWDHATDFSFYADAYPYARYFSTAQKGAGAARNRGAKEARGSFLFFLDADDMINFDYPEALQEMIDLWQETGAGIYSDYIGRAYIEDIDQLPKKLKNNLIAHDPNDNEAFIRHYASTFDYKRAVNEPQDNDPSKMYIWNLITTLIPTTWHFEINGFDEDMVTWEDWDYWLRIAKSGKDFKRIKEPFLVYKFYTGIRRELAHQSKDGRQIWQNMLEYMRNKHKDIEIMPCSGCGRKKVTSSPVTQVQVQMNDNEPILVEYLHPNMGGHHVAGATSKRRYSPPLRRKGDKFLVLPQDIAAQPHLFRPVQEKLPEPETKVTPEPKSLVEVETTELPILIANREFNVQLLPGIGPALAKMLAHDHNDSEEAILGLGVDGLAQYRGMSEQRAEMVIEAIKTMRE